MKKMIMRVGIFLLLALFLLAGTGVYQSALAQEQERGISLRATYPHLVVPLDKSEVEFSLTLTNTGKTGEEVLLRVDSAPEGWGYQFRSIYPENMIGSIYLPSKETDEDKAKQELRFRVLLPRNEIPGNYIFMIKAVTADNAIESPLSLTVSLTREIVSIETEEVDLTPESIVVRAEVGYNFEFVVHVNNRTEQDLTFDLETEVPPEWTVYITHGWREEKINTLMVQSEGTEDARLVVTPSPYQEPGKYPREYEVIFRVKSGEFEDSVDLRAVITATYELILTTSQERPQLNVTATAGQETHITLLLVNNGSASLEDISFTSSKPDGWDIKFTPDKLDSLDAQSTREIDVSIKPGEKAIAGDYATILKANSQQGSDSLDYRVTVETSTAWGWIGVIIAIIVIAALLGTFIMLRRR
jgi:uncharacterized membrane protein